MRQGGHVMVRDAKTEMCEAPSAAARLRLKRSSPCTSTLVLTYTYTSEQGCFPSPSYRRNVVAASTYRKVRSLRSILSAGPPLLPAKCVFSATPLLRRIARAPSKQAFPAALTVHGGIMIHGRRHGRPGYHTAETTRSRLRDKLQVQSWREWAVKSATINLSIVSTKSARHKPSAVSIAITSHLQDRDSTFVNITRHGVHH